MSLNPENWSIVILGRWNRAILTPSGIAKRLFGLESGTPVEVLVPLDNYGPYQVKYENTIVLAGDDRLVIQPVESCFENLEYAKTVAARSVGSLPETPLTAAGINVQYRTTEPIGAVADIMTHSSDSDLSDAEFKILARAHKRTVEWKDGRINITIQQEAEGEYVVGFNFDRPGKDVEELKSWLCTPIDQLEEATSCLLVKYLKLDLEDIDDGKKARHDHVSAG